MMAHLHKVENIAI